jgi:hypothetical protein
MWIVREGSKLRLQAFLDTPGPALARVRGPPGSGRSAFVRTCVEGREGLRWFTVLSLDPAGQDALLRAAWHAGEEPVPAEPSSDGPLPVTDRLAQRRGVLLVVDDADLLHASPRAAISALWTESRRQALPLHLLLVERRTTADEPHAEWPADTPAADLELGPFEAPDLARALPEWSARDRLAAWAVFGGYPGRLKHLRVRERLARTIERTLLDPEGALHHEGVEVFRARFQKPERYQAIALALAQGARDWGGLREAVAAFESSSQLAPYLAALEAHGLVRVERSLDARANARNRRYRLADPFLASWHHLVLPRLGHPPGIPTPALPGSTNPTSVDEVVDRRAQEAFPHACRQFLRRAPRSILPAAARQTGALWGEGYDMPVAGVLSNGAPVYGSCVWGREAVGVDADALDAQVRRTRFGFGRESRVRVVFTAGPVADELRRREARDPLLRVITLEQVLSSS